jgi:hypothetical protein
VSEGGASARGAFLAPALGAGNGLWGESGCRQMRGCAIAGDGGASAHEHEHLVHEVVARQVAKFAHLPAVEVVTDKQVRENARVSPFFLLTVAMGSLALALSDDGRTDR